MEREQKDIKSIFIYIGVAISLITAIVFFLNAAFSIIDWWLLPDSFTWFDFRYELFGQLPTYIAFLIVSFAVLLVLSRAAGDSIADDRQDIYHKLCQAVVMIILTLSLVTVFIAGAILLKDALGGDLSLAHALKSLLTIAVGITVFYYYRGVYRGTLRAHGKKIYMIGSCVVVGAVIVAGVIVINPTQRVAAEEMYEVLEYIERIESDAQYIFNSKNEVPEQIPDPKESYGFTLPEEDYVIYTKVSSSAYRVCASFSVLPPERVTDLRDYPYRDFTPTVIGENCFELSVEQ